MKSGSTMRVARPTDNLVAIAEMYAKGLGFAVLAEFKDHRGFDGVILGHPKQPYHIEFTSQRGHKVGNAPIQDHLLFFYIPDKNEWESRCAQMTSTGFREISSYNAYWTCRAGHSKISVDIALYYRMRRGLSRSLGALRHRRWRFDCARFANVASIISANASRRAF
jgi:hypothetical protein